MSIAQERAAAAAGLETEWEDVDGRRHRVAPQSIARILDALGPAADFEAPLITATTGVTVSLPPGRLVLEDGTEAGVSSTGRPWVPAVPGYHLLHGDAETTTVAVSPGRCWSVAEATGSRKALGLGVQIYALRGDGLAGFGDFTALADVAKAAGLAGVDAMMLSPAHAGFTAKADEYFPYSPSSRIALNELFATPPDSIAATATVGELVAWGEAGPARLAQLRAWFEQGDSHAASQPDPDLLNHARFEALDRRFRSEGHTTWRTWPDGLADAGSPAVMALGPSDPEVAFHLFTQRQARKALHRASNAALSAGMSIGLISDLAVGVDPSGSDAWARPREMLRGLTIGAPPDALGPDGQNWGLTGFSPQGLRSSGYRGFLSMLRAAMRDAGGVRIDHAMGLMRLWVIPEGGGAADGAYLRYPMTDLMRLVALESYRHKAIVIGEDLGTVPPSFRTAMNEIGMMGMRVLWFERDIKGAFADPATWPRESVAVTTTHDLPTTAGWWKGRDIEWRERVTGKADPDAHALRNQDRLALESALGSPSGDADTFTDLALEHVAQAGSDLVVVPIEDLFALDEQPNLPGTVDIHPNWRRRLPADAKLRRPDAARRLAALHRARSAP